MVKALTALRKLKKTGDKIKEGTQDLFADRFVSQLDEGQAPSRGTLDVEEGRAGTVTKGDLSEPRMQESASAGSRARAELVSILETKEEKGTITKKEKKMLDDLNAMSEEADVSRSRKAASTRSSDARKDEGVSLMTEDGPRRIGSKPKLKDSDMLVGNTDNGITKDGEIIGNPTDNQIQAVVRNMEAREKLSKDAKQNLARLKNLKTKDKQDRAISIMERNMVDTGPDTTGGIMGRP
jgi:hypothetical protein